MRIGFVALACVVGWVIGGPVLAQTGTPCLDPDITVPEMADNPSHGWLTREGPELVRARLVKAAGNHKTRWDGSTLMVSCTVGGGPEYEMAAATVGSDTSSGPVPKGGKDYFLRLAQRTGHTAHEADVLYVKYARLAGSSYRYLRDATGTQVSEADSILRHRARVLGITAPAAPAAPGADLQKRAAALKARAEAAKQRGDMNEMMRIAAEAQQLAAPSAAQAQQINQRTDQQSWLLLESAYGELAQAAWPTRVTFLNCPCLGCTVRP